MNGIFNDDLTEFDLRGCGFDSFHLNNEYKNQIKFKVN